MTDLGESGVPSAEGEEIRKRLGEEAAPSGTTKRRKGEEEERESVDWSKLPIEIWKRILQRELPQRDAFAFASSCKQFRGIQVASKVKLVTRRKEVVDNRPEAVLSEVSEGWCSWHSRIFGVVGNDEEEAFFEKAPVEEAEVILWAAAFYGYLDMLKMWMPWRKDEMLWTKFVCYFAVQGDQLETLTWLRSHDCPWQDVDSDGDIVDSACMTAARWGRFGILKWLKSEGCRWGDKGECRDEAQERGHAEIASWIDGQDDDEEDSDW